VQIDRRVLFFGESFVAGTGDPTGRGGWVGRVVAASFDAGLALSAYNLGVRRETSLDVEARLLAEARPRMRDEDAAYGVVLHLGVNDTSCEDGQVRVEPGLAVDALGRMLAVAAGLGARTFVVGPAPSLDAAQDERIRALSAALAEVAAAAGAPFVEVIDALCAHDGWAAEARAGDGVHPGAGGYDELARLVLAGGWLDWLAGLQAG
jgi:lysophospholipase L1-like esterase